MASPHPNGIPYGMLYHTVADGLTVDTVNAGAGVYQLAEFFSDVTGGNPGHVGPAVDSELVASVAADGITVVRAGLYKAVFTASVVGDAAGARVYNAQFRVLAVVPAAPNIIDTEWSAADATTPVQVAMSGILNLAAGDEVTIWVASAPAAADNIGCYTAQLSLTGIF